MLRPHRRRCWLKVTLNSSATFKPHMQFFFLAVQVQESPQLLLSACLSCEGCLSEEESLKISQQNLEEVKRVLALNKVQYHWAQPPTPPVNLAGQGTVLCHCHRQLQPLVVFQKCDASKHKVLVASVCPQSLPFFAVKFGVDITVAAHKLCGFLKSIGEQVGVTSLVGWLGGFFQTENNLMGLNYAKIYFWCFLSCFFFSW